MNNSHSKSRTERRRVIAEFPDWVDGSMTILVNNTLSVFEATSPKVIENEVVSFLGNQACWGVTDSLVLFVYEAGLLLNKELSEQGAENSLQNDLDFKNIRRVRNKITAHGVENHAEYPAHLEWHKKNNSDLSVFLPYLLTVAKKISDQIKNLQSHNLLPLKHYKTLPSKFRPFGKSEVEEIFEALNSAGLL